MTKSRLTITLAQSTLQQIDQLIDKKKIRSRSHAIEYILQQNLQPIIKSAVILAGSKNPQQKTIKALTLLDNQPLITYTLAHLQKYGIKQVYILTNLAGKKIAQVLQNHHFNLTIHYLYEKQPLGTAGSLKQLAGTLNQEHFFLIHGDVLTDINLHDLTTFHLDNKAIITMAVKPRIPQKTYGNVFIQGHTVVDFQAKKPGQAVSIVNTGVYLIAPAIFDLIPDQTPTTLEHDIFPKLTHNKGLVAFTFQGSWFDIESDKNYQQALQKIKGTL